MKKFIQLPLTMCLLILLVGCEQEKTIQLTVKQLSLDKKSTITSKVDVSFYESGESGKIKYSNVAASNYAKKYAGLKDNVCGVFNDDDGKNRTDCAHFIAHCLHAGGIKIEAEIPNPTICPMNLCYRVKELTESLKKLSVDYDNISQIEISDAIHWDYGFFNVAYVRPSHAFMVCKPEANVKDMTIYAHTTNRNCSKAEPNWYNFFDVAYRIADSN